MESKREKELLTDQWESGWSHSNREPPIFSLVPWRAKHQDESEITKSWLVPLLPVYVCWHLGSTGEPYLNLGQKVLQHVVQHVGIFNLFPIKCGVADQSIQNAAFGSNSTIQWSLIKAYPLSLLLGFQPVSPERNICKSYDALKRNIKTQVCCTPTKHLLMPGMLSTGICRTPSLKQVRPG